MYVILAYKYTCVYVCAFMTIGTHVAQDNVNLCRVLFVGFRTLSQTVYNRENLLWLNNSMETCYVRKQCNGNYQLTTLVTCYFEN